MKTGEKPRETELKLVTTGPHAEGAVIEKLIESGYKIDKQVSIRNNDLYLDTYDWALMKNKLSLRYRIENGRAMYTLKSIGGFENGIAQRDELEIALDRPVENPQKIAVEPIRDQVMPLIYPRQPIELLRVATSRKEYSVITPEGAVVSLAFDTSGFSRLRHPGRRCLNKFYEMEAELKEGDVSALNSLRKLIGTFNYSFSDKSKMQRGIEFLNLEPLRRKPVKELTVDIDDPLKIALLKIIAAEYKWFQEQLPGVIADSDPEFVHQARVTTRRMRSAFRVFREAYPENIIEPLADGLKWLAGLFGAVRDTDVYIINLEKFKQQLDYFPPDTRDGLEKRIARLRRKPFKKLLDALDSSRYRELKAGIRNLTGYRPLAIRRKVAGMKTIRQFAPEVIKQEFQAVIARGQDVLANPEMNKFHLLRIEMKKLRYATEFMAPAYSGALSEFIKRMTEIQDCLGELQDTVFTREFSKKLMKVPEKKDRDPRIPFILGEIYRFQADIAKERRDTFAGIWSHFASREVSNLLARVFAEKNQPALPAGPS